MPDAGLPGRPPLTSYNWATVNQRCEDNHNIVAKEHEVEKQVKTVLQPVNRLNSGKAVAG